MDPQQEAGPGLVERSYRGRDLDDAQRRAWEDLAAAWSGGYVAVAQRWDPASRTLTVRYARQLPPPPGIAAVPELGPGLAPEPDPARGIQAGAGPVLIPAGPASLPRWRIMAALVLVVVLGASAVAARFAERLVVREPTVIRAGSDTGPVPRLEPAVCRGPRVALMVPRCGDLIVPEDRTRPEGTRIRLHYAVYPSRSGSTAPDPVVYLDGGPGGSPLADGFPTEPFVAARELVVLDQRGTGFSEPSLDCDELDSLGAVTELLEQLAALRACRDRLIGQGVDLARYTSADSASDVDDLRAALGYATWDLYGVSYGTRLALTVMRDHPAGVRSAILDSVYPPQVDAIGEQAANAERAFRKLFDACAAQPSCAAAYPDLEGTLMRTVGDLDVRTPEVTRRTESGAATVELDGDLLLGYLFDRFYDTASLSGLPMAIAAVRDGAYDDLADWALQAPSVDRTMVDQDLSEGMHLSVQCAEEAPFTTPDRATSGALGARLSRAFGGEDIRRRCDLWDVPAGAEREQRAVTSAIPTLLLSGAYDPITPPAWADQAARSLSQAQAFEFPGAGHGVLGTTSCADGLVSDFMTAPDARLDARCIANLGLPRFAVP